jgi:hypothetical protein
MVAQERRRAARIKYERNLDLQGKRKRSERARRYRAKFREKFVTHPYSAPQPQPVEPDPEPIAPASTTPARLPVGWKAVLHVLFALALDRAALDRDAVALVGGGLGPVAQGGSAHAPGPPARARAPDGGSGLLVPPIAFDSHSPPISSTTWSARRHATP